jgi:hypothetical protein
LTALSKALVDDAGKVLTRGPALRKEQAAEQRQPTIEIAGPVFVGSCNLKE